MTGATPGKSRAFEHRARTVARGPSRRPRVESLDAVLTGSFGAALRRRRMRRRTRCHHRRRHDRRRNSRYRGRRFPRQFGERGLDRRRVVPRSAPGHGSGNVGARRLRLPRRSALAVGNGRPSRELVSRAWINRNEAKSRSCRAVSSLMAAGPRGGYTVGHASRTPQMHERTMHRWGTSGRQIVETGQSWDRVEGHTDVRAGQARREAL